MAKKESESLESIMKNANSLQQMIDSGELDDLFRKCKPKQSAPTLRFFCNASENKENLRKDDDNNNSPSVACNSAKLIKS